MRLTTPALPGVSVRLQERERSAAPSHEGGGGDRNQGQGQSAAAPVPSLWASWGTMRWGKAPRLFERVAEPTGGRNAAWQPGRARGQSSGDGVSATARTRLPAAA